MKIIQTAILGLLLTGSQLAAASNGSTYFINPSNNPITLHYKACHDAEPACESSEVKDAVIPAHAYVEVEIPGPSSRVPYGEKEIKVVSMEAFGSSITFSSSEFALNTCGVNPQAIGNNAVKYEQINDALVCSKVNFKKL